MPDNRKPYKAEIREAIKVDVKDLRLLSSSARRAQIKRDENQVEKASRAMDQAVEDLLKKDAKSGPQGRPG